MKYLIFVLITWNAYSADIESIRRNNSSNPTRSNEIVFTIRFTEAVENVQISDFRINTLGRVLRQPQIIDVYSQTSGQVYNVIVRGYSCEAEIRVDLNDSDRSILDMSGRPLGRSYHIGDQAYTVDNIGPSMLHLFRSGLTRTESPYRFVDTFTVIFDEPVRSVYSSHFFASGGAYVNFVTGFGTTWRVETVKNRKDQFISLMLSDPGRSITDYLGNPRRY